ncbi:hypothetical protein [Nocardioides sp. WS12]|uniref:hypothetical protein n=1 Tax=Nocardioides sp. WS12 TaxID=2486272 RepID=UPI0015FA5A80|nr:hypothetical protein [Nocardioides sp. WS12]
MALSDELTDLLARTGNGILSDAASFGAALDDFLTPEAASRGVINLLVDAVRQGAFDRMQRDITHGGDPHMAVAAAGDQLARDRAATDVAPSRWAVAVLGVAAGVLDRGVLDGQTAPGPSVPQAAAPGPSVPQAAAPAAPPPYVPAPPPVAPTVAPTAAPPPWRPPGPATPRRRTGLIVGAVMLALALVGGGTTAAILIAKDDPSARRTDPTTDPTTGGTTDGPTTDSTTDVPPVADEFAIAELMKQVATDSFPGAVDPEVTARSWSVASTNLSDGFPRELAVGERADATAWSVRTTIDIRRLDIRAEHEPSDGGSYYDWDCGQFQASGDVLAECTDVTTGDGRTAIEYWYINPTLKSASHNLVVPADRATGRLEVFVGERLSEPPAGLTIADLKEKLQLSSRAMLEIAEDPRLRLPAPDPLPPLPSYGFCFDADPKPAGCPADLG